MRITGFGVKKRSRGGLTRVAMMAVPATLAVGCTTHADLATVGTEPASIVQLDLTYSRELAASAPTRLEAEAHFVRYRAADRNLDKTAVAGLLGIGNVGSADDIARDTCRFADHGETASVTTGTGALEVALLDAGTLTLRAGGLTEAVVEPQHYPELFPFVSGVVYGLETAPAREVVPASRIEIEANGGEDVGPFTAATTLPGAFPNLSLGTSSQDGLELAWSTIASATAPIDIELRWAGSRNGVVHCRAVDDGSFVIPKAVTDGLDAAIGAGANAEVSAARSERASLDAPGVGRGQVIVTLRDVLALSNVAP